MTTTTSNPAAVRLDFDTHAAVFSEALAHLDHAATKQLDSVDIDHRLRELLRLRASQLNGCAYCVDMHTQGRPRGRRGAAPAVRAAGLARGAVLLGRRARRVRVHRGHVAMADTHVPSEVYAALAEHYGPDEIAALVALVVTVNAWNAIGVSTRAWEPGSYQP